MGGENQDGEQTSEATAVVNIKIKPGCDVVVITALLIVFIPRQSSDKSSFYSI
jgi:hypothetical protein